MVKELYLFRISYGLLMTIYSTNKCTDDVYQPNFGVYFDFRHRIPSDLQSAFQSFPWYTHSDLYWKIHCPLMLLTAVGIAFGHGNMSRICCLVYSLLKGVLLLLDQTKYNNHEYLYSTLALMLCFIDCHDIQAYSLSICMSLKGRLLQIVSSITLVCSLLYLMLNNAVYGIPGISGLTAVLLMWFSLVVLLGLQPHPTKNVNSLWYQKLVLQLFVGAVYFYAGLAKTDTDWLSGSTARELLLHWSMDAGSASSLAQQVVRSSCSLLSITEERFYVMFAYCGMLLDVTAAPGLMIPFSYTRMAHTALLVGFHTANHFLFILETFPFVMISTCVLYHDDHWIEYVKNVTLGVVQSVESRLSTVVKRCEHFCEFLTKCWSYLQLLLLTMLLITHLLIPLRCAIHTPFDLGTVAWSTSCQYFQWRMMTRSVRTVASHLRVVHPETQEMQIVTLDMLGLNLCPHQLQRQQRESGVPEEVCTDKREFLLTTPQYEDRLYQTIRDARQRAVSPEDATRGLVFPPRVYADVWLEINGPPMQRYVRPNVDIGGRETLSSVTTARNYKSVSYLTEWLSDAFVKPEPLADWVMPRFEQFRTVEWIQRMQNITTTEKTKQLRRWRKNGVSESDIAEKSKRLEVAYLADEPSSGESYFYFYRSARVQLLQGSAYLFSQGYINSSSGSEHLLQGIVKWFAVSQYSSDCSGDVCPSTISSPSEAVLWKIVLPDGADYFEIKPFDDGRIKSVK